MVVLSLPLFMVHSIGYSRNQHGFQGVFNHPQVFGITVAFMAAISGGRIMERRNPRWTEIILFCFFLALMVLSEARSAGLALLLGLVGTIVLSLVCEKNSRRMVLPGIRSKRVLILIYCLLISVILMGSMFTDVILGYISKGHANSGSVVDIAQASRGALVERMISNIQEHPWIGIGFGVASDFREFMLVFDPVFGLPIGAATEKGVMPVAVLEELGVFCALAVSGWFIIMLRSVRDTGYAPAICVFFTVLFVNLGENLFFSVGGLGMLLLIFFTGSVTFNRYEVMI